MDIPCYAGANVLPVRRNLELDGFDVGQNYGFAAGLQSAHRQHLTRWLEDFLLCAFPPPLYLFLLANRQAVPVTRDELLARNVATSTELVGFLGLKCVEVLTVATI